MTNDFYNKVVEETNKYATLSQRKVGTVDNNWEEIQAYIGILIYMGPVDLPEIEDYFQGDFCICSIVRQAMTKTIKKLGQYLHLNDEEERPDQQSADFDLLYKARPALDLMDKFTQAYIHRLRTCCGRGDDWFQGEIFSETFSTWKAN